MPSSIDYFKQDNPVTPPPVAGVGDAKMLIDGSNNRFPWTIAFIIVIFFTILFGGGYYFFWASGYLFKTYDDCVNAGNPIDSNFPASCTTKSGRRFTEPLPSISPFPSPIGINKPIISTPSIDSLVSSPLVIEGELPSGWMFEGVTNINLVNQDGDIVSQGQAKELTPGSWQTGEPIKFTCTLIFKTVTSKGGLIIIKKDNPSGLPENDAEFTLPIKFE